MPKLVICEFAKLKRKKFILLVILSAFLFPMPLTVLMKMDRMTEGYDSVRSFNEYFQFVMGYGVQLLLPCVLGVIAAMLFFMERDNDTFKNMRMIPVTSTQMIFAKIIVLFFFGVIFSLASAMIAILCGGLMAEVNNIVYRLFIAVEMGIFITAGTLPLIVVVVFFSKTYVFSVLLCVFYSVLSLTVESLFFVLPQRICWLMPIPLTTLWCTGDMIRHGIMNGRGILKYLIPSTLQTIAILGFMALFCVVLIIYMYKRRGDE